MKEVNDNSVKMVNEHRGKWPSEFIHKQVKNLKLYFYSFMIFTFYLSRSKFSRRHIDDNFSYFIKKKTTKNKQTKKKKTNKKKNKKKTNKQKQTKKQDLTFQLHFLDLRQFAYITKTRLFKYTENFTTKNDNFSDKKI